MPPFESEPVERKQQAIRFLKQHVRDPPSSQSTSGVFGAEKPEGGNEKRQVQPKNKVNAPFQDEVGESEFIPPTKQTSKRPKPSKPEVAPFQDEDAEDLGSNSSPSSGEEVAQQPGNIVFGLGWQSVQRFQQGSFWKENMNENQEKLKPKRTYDNSKREATAAYARRDKQGVFKSNGVDPARVQKLFDSQSCHCN